MKRASWTFLALVAIAGCTEQPTSSAVRPPAAAPSVEAMALRAAHASAAPATTYFSGWVERAYATSATSYDTISAYWTIPSNPLGSYGDTSSHVFYSTFPALENSYLTAILQPVLTFSAEWGGGARWTLVNEQVHGSTALLRDDGQAQQLTRGDTIYGRVSDTLCNIGHSTCTWRILAHDISGGVTRADTVTDTWGPFTRAIGGAVEVGNISQCAQYPWGGAFYHDVYVSAGGQRFTPTWTDSVSSGVSPSCSFSVYSNLDTVKLYHNYPPPDTLKATISGPSRIRPNTPCRYIAIPTGGARPISYDWNPRYSQEDSSVIVILSWQAILYLTARDSLNQVAQASKYITVTPSAPACPSTPSH